VYYSADKSQITNIVCSLHGSLNESTQGLISVAGTSPSEVFDATLAALNLGFADAVDSTTTNGTNYAKMMDYFTNTLGVDLNEFGIKSWCVSKTEGATVIWWTDQDVAACSVGDSIRVIRYNTKKNTYTAGYITVTKKTFEDQTYNVMSCSIRGTQLNDYFTEQAGQTGATKKDYDQTLSVFNNMDAAK
ncbi:MAG: hypothetical protein VB092_01480, partial [Oscillospiraceae bacterium]|nr:hypothetical protein [Oscillospiraceae bacterium]